MNAIVAQEHPRLPALQSGGAIRPIVPQDFDGAWRIANAVVKAGMAPKGLETPEKAMVAIMHGLEVGMTPMASLQSIAVINSRATIWGDGALGLVQASGKMESHKEWFEGAGDTRKALCTVSRKGDPEPKHGEFSVADAKKAALWGKAGPWQQYPDRMLKMRARAFALRDGFSDVLKGLGIAEEVQDVQLIREAPPVPPKVPTPPDPNAGRKIEDAEVVDAETGEITDVPDDTLGDFFTDLENRMAAANNAAEIAEVWNDADPLARFEGDDDSQALAQSIKRRHVNRVAGARL